MLKLTPGLLLCILCIITSESFFISNRDIRRFFGFFPAKVYRSLKTNLDHEDSSDEIDGPIYKKTYPYSINEKLNKYSRGRPAELLDLENSDHYENIEGYTKTRQHSKYKKPVDESSKILKVRIVKDEKHIKNENELSKVLLLVPDGGEKTDRYEEESFGSNLKHFSPYSSLYHEDFHNDPSFFY